MWAILHCYIVELGLSSQRNLTKQFRCKCMAFDTFSSFFNQIGHYWMPKRLYSKNSDQLPVLNRLTDIFAVGKFDYGVMVRYQDLTRKPKLFRARLGPGPVYPLNPPVAGPVANYKGMIALRNLEQDRFSVAFGHPFP